MERRNQFGKISITKNIILMTSRHWVVMLDEKPWAICDSEEQSKYVISELTREFINELSQDKTKTFWSEPSASTINKSYIYRKSQGMLFDGLKEKYVTFSYHLVGEAYTPFKSIEEGEIVREH